MLQPREDILGPTDTRLNVGEIARLGLGAGSATSTARRRRPLCATTGAAACISAAAATTRSGWRTGARVHVAFQTTADCAGAPAGPCFQGVIRVERAPKE